MPGCTHKRSARIAPVRLLRACEGTSAIEVAILLPVLLLMLFGIIEFGRLMWTQASLQAAVEAAARCLAVNQSQCTSSNIGQYVDNQLANYGLSAQPTVTTPSASCGSGYQVSASLQFQFVIANLFPSPPTLSAQSCYPG